MVPNPLESMADIGSAWDAFKAASPDTGRIGTVAADLFADDAAFVCVPTGAGASGNPDIVTFLRKVASQSSVVESEQIIGRAVGPSSVVEEAILVFTHESVLDWILPEVKATRKRVVVPVITVANFNENGKIASIRKYWDQASVLRQLGILPISMFCKANSSETTLPIHGPRIVDKLQSAVSNVVAIELPEEPASRPASTTAAGSRNDSSRRRHQPVTGILPQGSDDIPVRPNASRQHKNASSILASDGAMGSDDAGSSPGRVRPSTRVAQVPGGRTNNIFDIGSDPLPLKTSVPIDPRRFQTQIALYDDSSAPAEPVSKPGNRRDPNWNAEAASSAAVVERPSVAKPPGMTKAPSANASQWSIGHAESNVAPVHTGKRMGPVYANESHWSLGVQPASAPAPAAAAPAAPASVASEPANVEDVQEEVVEPEAVEEEEPVDEVEVPEQHHQVEEEAEVEYAAVEESVVPGAKSTASQVKSGLLFGADEPIARPNRRDPNARSEFTQSRPSARVMAPPGGNSTISLG
ncbi:hypothetical protein BJ742DRAFT_744402 [Cladochytrium replicatum]|nr:hypothetical protein BJ742DRAFT_744402 [Cladochytrium replicatum]